MFSSQESAVLQGKVRPPPERNARPEKAPLAGKSDVKLREKQKDFELRDYQAQRVRNLGKTSSKLRLQKKVLSGDVLWSMEKGLPLTLDIFQQSFLLEVRCHTLFKACKPRATLL